MGVKLWSLPQLFPRTHQLAAVKKTRDERAERGEQEIFCSLPLSLQPVLACTPRRRQLLLRWRWRWWGWRWRRGDGGRQQWGEGARGAGGVGWTGHGQRRNCCCECCDGLSGERGARVRLHARTETQRLVLCLNADRVHTLLTHAAQVRAPATLSSSGVRQTEPRGLQNHLTRVSLDKDAKKKRSWRNPRSGFRCSLN